MKQQTAEWVVDLSNPNADKITSDSTTNVSISNKQSMTAVEWLYNLSKQRELDKFDLEQAKQMEKEQIIKAYCDGFWQGSGGNIILSEEYYNETFNK